jgi:hypothetical protein
MKKTLIFFWIILLFSACGKTSATFPSLTKDEITGDRLWQRITAEEEYKAYPEWPGFEGLRRGQSPHGRYHEIYIHPLLRNALPLTNKVVPDGTIIVKDNYDADKKRTHFTVMAKVTGYDPEHADWFWAAYDPQGKTVAEGKVGMCIACHEGKKDNDYVIVRPLDLPLVTQ